MKPTAKKKSNYGNRYGEEFDLGLAILAATRPPGYRASYTEIAAYTGTDRRGVFMAELAILQKLRRKAMLHNNPLLNELGASLGLRNAHHREEIG